MESKDQPEPDVTSRCGSSPQVVEIALRSGRRLMLAGLTGIPDACLLQSPKQLFTWAKAE